MEAEWSDDKTIALINLYEANSCLYNVSSLEYRNRDRKRVCIQNIATSLKNELTEECYENLADINRPTFE